MFLRRNWNWFRLIASRDFLAKWERPSRVEACDPTTEKRIREWLMTLKKWPDVIDELVSLTKQREWMIHRSEPKLLHFELEGDRFSELVRSKIVDLFRWAPRLFNKSATSECFIEAFVIFSEWSLSSRRVDNGNFGENMFRLNFPWLGVSFAQLEVLREDLNTFRRLTARRVANDRVWELFWNKFALEYVKRCRWFICALKGEQHGLCLRMT